MKILISLALAAAMVLGLAACGGNKESSGPDFRVQDAMDAMLDRVGADDMITLSEGDMLGFYGIRAEDMEQFSAAITATGISAKEIVLVKAISEDAAKRVREQLDKRVANRMTEFENYLPDQFDIVANHSRVSRDGVYVSLIISNELEDLSIIYSGFLNGNQYKTS